MLSSKASLSPPSRTVVCKRDRGHGVGGDIEADLLDAPAPICHDPAGLADDLQHVGVEAPHRDYPVPGYFSWLVTTEPKKALSPRDMNRGNAA